MLTREALRDSQASGVSFGCALPAVSIGHDWGFPGHGLYATSAGCHGGISDNTLGRLIAKSLDRQGSIAFHCPASPGSTSLDKAGFIDIGIGISTVNYSHIQ